MKLRDITANDIYRGNGPQLIVCILIDASYSMIDPFSDENTRESKIKVVNDGISAFIESGKKDIYARDALDVCLISYGGEKAEVIQEFTNVQNIEFKGIRPNGKTPLKSAVEFALDKIAQRREYWSSSGTSTFHPWLIILSDGKSDEDITETAARLQKLYAEHRLKGKCVAIGRDSDTADLKKLAPNGKIEEMDSMEITSFFSMLSKSAASLSMSTPDADDYGAEIRV
ncbi:MAG: VWA domain-containing protein [Solobacterium sp.]|nr:VWA domain-containing protein [Solobacterium sp.]